MTPQTIDRDPGFEAELIAYLAAAGYKVTKARAPRITTGGTWPRLGGTTPAKAPKGHDHCAEHWKVEGYRKPICIARAGTMREDGRDTGEPIPPAWTDAPTALRFALDLAAMQPDPSATHDRAWWDAWHTERNSSIAAQKATEITEAEISRLEAEGMTRSDAQSVAMAQQVAA